MLLQSNRSGSCTPTRGESTPDEVTSGLGKLEITQADSKSAIEAAAETAGPCTEGEEQKSDCCSRNAEGEVCSGNAEKVGESPSYSDSMVNADLASDIGVSQFRDSIIADDNDEDNAAETDEEQMSAVNDCMSALTLETSAPAKHVCDDRDWHVDNGTVEIVSKCFNNMTVNEVNYEHHYDEVKNETDCVSMMSPESSSVSNFVSGDEREHDGIAGTVTLMSDCSSVSCEQHCDGNAGPMTLMSDCSGVTNEQQHDGNAATIKFMSDCSSVSYEQQYDGNAGPMTLMSDCNSVSNEQQHDGNAATMKLMSDCSSVSNKNEHDGNDGTMALTSDCSNSTRIDDSVAQNCHDDDDKNNIEEAAADDVGDDDDGDSEDNHIDSSSIVTNSKFYVFS